MPQQWKYAPNKTLHKQKNRTECGNLRGTAFVAHVGKGFLKIIACRLSDYCEVKGIRPQEQCGFRPQRSTVGMTFVVRGLQELATAEDIPLHTCFIDLHKAYDSVDRDLLWSSCKLIRPRGLCPFPIDNSTEQRRRWLYGH